MNLSRMIYPSGSYYYDWYYHYDHYTRYLRSYCSYLILLLCFCFINLVCVSTRIRSQPSRLPR